MDNRVLLDDDTVYDDSELFTAIREILGRGLTPAEFKKIVAARVREEVAAVTASVAAGQTVAVPGMQPSPAIIAFLHEFETLQLVPYKDPGSVNGLPITCGWGSTTHLDGRKIKLGEAPWTKEYANQVFAKDLKAFTAGLNFLIGKRPTTQNQFDAMFSFAYNCGLDIDDDTKAEGLGDSTLLKKHLAGDYAGAARQFASWNKNDGKVLNGLTRRRGREAEIYLRP
jgi:lysozyme